MGRVTESARRRYTEKVREYKQRIEQIQARERSLLKAAAADDEGGAAFKRLAVAEGRLNMASYQLLINRVALALINVKNEGALNEARKSCYECVIRLEEVVSDQLDAPFSDYSDRLELIEAFDRKHRYDLIRKLGFTIDSVKEDYGENSKWRWSFVDLDGRFAVVAKNMLNLKTIIADLDPENGDYAVVDRHLKLAVQLLQSSADRFRQKYELSTTRIDDFRRAIAFLGAARRIQMLLGENEEVETIKKKMGVWTTKLEADERKVDSRK